MKFNIFGREIKLVQFLPLFIGAGLGYAYYYFIGCYSGTCPIQSNPYISTLYGALMGAVFLFPSKKKSKNGEQNVKEENN